MIKILKKIPFKAFGLAILFGMGVFVSIKVQQIGKRLQEIKRCERGFEPSHIVCKFPYRKDWDVNVSEDLTTFVNVITQQPFHYLAKGFQAYAFMSQDGEYVLKFFQQQRLRERPFKEEPLKYMFDKSYREKAAFKLRHKEEIFSSSKLSFEEIPEETGIIYVHLNKTDGELRGIRLYDQRGQACKIKPDSVSFIIQRRADYVIPTITALMKKGDIEGAKRRVDQIIDLLLVLARKKIADSDYALIRNNNIGFSKDRAIYIDTGHLSKNDDLNVYKRMKYEFSVRLKPLYEWMKINYPDLADYYLEKKADLLDSLEKE